MKKKIRKEFLIVGAVVVVFLLTIVIPKVVGGGGLYDKSHVTADFTEDGVVQDNTVIDDGPSYGYEGTVAGTDVEELPNSALTVEGQTLEVGKSDDEETSDEPQEVVPEPAPEERLSPQQYVDLAMRYICGIKDSNFDTYLTMFMKDKFESIGSTEPYNSLKGNTTFNNVSISNTDSSFSFVDGDGSTYTVMVLFNGSLISSIEVIDKG